MNDIFLVTYNLYLHRVKILIILFGYKVVSSFV
jgi:hypothetical protein